jgi:hypothetical protein
VSFNGKYKTIEKSLNTSVKNGRKTKKNGGDKMTITANYKNAFTEVYTILDYLDEEDYKKIPQQLISAIEQNRNLDYEYIVNEEVDLNNQPMLSETKAILFNIFRDYLSTPKQKQSIIKMQMKERQKDEEQKRAKYNAEEIFEKKLNIQDTAKEPQQEKALIEVKEENFIMKIINKIRSIFRRKNK